MSSIDCYSHQRLGWIRCPFIEPRSGQQILELAIYRLLEPASDDLNASVGDVIVGGGSGEWGSFIIRYPKGIVFAASNFANDDLANDDLEMSSLYEARWSWNCGYMLLSGFASVGWAPDQNIETWIAERVSSFLVSEYPEFYRDLSIDHVSDAWRSLIRRDFQDHE